MLKTCSYCGRVHDSRMDCPQKIAKRSKYASDTIASHLRNLSHWQKIRDHVRRRDNNVCQLCLRNYPGTIRPYEVEGLSVHHIIKIEQDSDKAFDELNLITLCRIHHEMAEQGKIERALLESIAKENSERAAN